MGFRNFSQTKKVKKYCFILYFLRWIPANYNWKDATKLYIHWLLYNNPTRTYQQKFGIAKTSVNALISFFNEKVTTIYIV
jgi:hypothetical protein